MKTPLLALALALLLGGVAALAPAAEARAPACTFLEPDCPDHVCAFPTYDPATGRHSWKACAPGSLDCPTGPCIPPL